MSQDLKQIIREEYLKCAQDPAHFMKKYCHIQHPTRGRIIFNLYPFQEKVLRLWRDHPYDTDGSINILYQEAIARGN